MGVIAKNAVGIPIMNILLLKKMLIISQTGFSITDHKEQSDSNEDLLRDGSSSSGFEN